MYFFSSQDYVLRMRADQVRCIDFVHLNTDELVLDGAGLGDVDEIHCTGTTEWCGSAGDVKVSLAWDWRMDVGGGVRLSTFVAPRTNITIIDDKGYDLVGDAATSVLQEIIEAIPWQTIVCQRK